MYMQIVCEQFAEQIYAALDLDTLLNLIVHFFNFY